MASGAAEREATVRARLPLRTGPAILSGAENGKKQHGILATSPGGLAVRGNRVRGSQLSPRTGSDPGSARAC